MCRLSSGIGRWRQSDFGRPSDIGKPGIIRWSGVGRRSGRSSDIGRRDIERRARDQVEDQATLWYQEEQVGRLNRGPSDIR